MTTVGTCLCEAIEVTCDEKPEEIIACHCESCQKATGGLGTYNVVMAESSCRISKGQPKVFKEQADSGATLERHFCGDCGSPIFSATPTFAGCLILKAGLFSGLDGMKVVSNIYTDSVASWAHLDPDIPTYGKMPS